MARVYKHTQQYIVNYTWQGLEDDLFVLRPEVHKWIREQLQEAVRMAREEQAKT